MAIRAFVALLGAVLIAVLSSGSARSSSPPNGVESKSPNAIVAAAVAAGSGARSVHVVGAIKSESLAFNLRIGAHGGRGHIDIGPGVGFDFVRVAGGPVYFNATKAFWLKYGGTKVAPFVSLVVGRWMKVSTTSGDFRSFVPLTELPTLLHGILDDHGKLVKAGTAVRQGQQAVAVRDTSDGSTLYVATTGKPYPLSLEKPGTSGGALAFREWGAPLTLVVPKNAVDISAIVNASASTRVTVLVATALIPKGTRGDSIVGRHLFKKVRLLRDARVPGAISSPAGLAGKVAVVDILPGSQLRASQFRSVG